MGPRFRARLGGTHRLRPRLLGRPRPRLDASKNPAGPREQLIVVERFHDVVVGADEEPLQPCPLASSSRARRR